jgi:colanic acid/amylovoran biosynthesis glycosyltransferase
MTGSPTQAAEDDRPVVAIYRSPLFNASETFVRAHAEALSRYRPVLVGLERKGNVPAALAEAMLVPDSRWERLGIRTLGWVAPLAERLRMLRPQLVHAHFATDGLLALPLARALDVPLVTTLHGYDVARSRRHMLRSGRLSWMRYALLQRRLMEGAALFLAVSDAVRRAAIARGYPEARTRTHYLGVDLQRFMPGEAPEPGLVLHVGRLVEKKGTAVLLDALALVRQSRGDAQLLVIGDGPERPRLERRTATLGLGDAVRFAGALPPDDVAAWMRRAWLLAAPSVTARDGDAEGLPTVLMEAAASALPTVGSDHSGIPEAIVDGESGYVVPERDVPALASRLTALLGNADLRGRMGAAARRLAEERFDATRQTERLEAIYDGLAGQTRP